jgi:thiol-disulfide isomerase/thioredoxin
VTAQRRLVTIAGRAALALALACAACGHAPAPAAPPPPTTPSELVDGEVPAFRRPTLQGEAFDTAGAAGRVLVVDFFADYCRPCQRTLPALEALHRAHPELVVVGVSLDADAAGARRSVVRHRLTFPVVHDEGNVLAGRFRVTELPFAFVVDAGGRVRFAAGPGQPEDAVSRAALSVTR